MTGAEVVLVAAVTLVGLIAGNELATLSVVHPSLDRVPYPGSRAAAQEIVGMYGRVMPVAMPLTIAVTFLAGLLLEGTPALLLFIAGAALVVMVILTFVRLAPLNTKQLAADDSTPAAEWGSWRAEWRRFHIVRVVLDIGALILAAVAAVMA